MQLANSVRLSIYFDPLPALTKSKEGLVQIIGKIRGNSIFHLSLELLTKFWKTSLKVAWFIVDFYTF